MALFECEILVRGYELAPDFRLPPWGFLRYMEQLRWESRGASKLDLRAFFHGSFHFVVVAQRLEVQQYPSVGDRLLAALHLPRVGRSSAEFLHDFRLGGEPVARGTSTVVWLGPDGRPTALPDELRALQDPTVAQAEVGPLPDACPPDAFEHAVRVRRSDTDFLQHVNHASYLAFVEDGRHAAGPGELRPESRPRLLAIEYRRESLLGERLRVRIFPLGADALGAYVTAEDETAPRCRVRLELGCSDPPERTRP